MRPAQFAVQDVLRPTAEHVELVCAADAPLGPLQPGQFYQLLCGESPATYLPRPLSFYRVFDERTVSFLLHAVGPGTRWLSERRPGDRIAAFGPLGQPFGVEPGVRRATLVGGGVGVPPLWLLASRLGRAGAAVRVLLGARSAALLLGVEAFAALGARVEVATDDGSAGHRGRVGELLGAEPADAWYACGPLGMLRDVQRRAAAAQAPPCHLALEAPMACGYGVCMGCVVERSAPDPALGDYGRWVRVCREGPVFGAQEVVL